MILLTLNGQFMQLNNCTVAVKPSLTDIVHPPHVAHPVEHVGEVMVFWNVGLERLDVFHRLVGISVGQRATVTQNNLSMGDPLSLFKKLSDRFPVSRSERRNLDRAAL